MHKQLVSGMVESVRARIAQGDCPTEAPFAREQLEDALVSLADMADFTTDELRSICTALDTVANLRAENARLREAVENLTQELQRCATDGGGYSCTVVDEARAALKETP